MAVLFPDLVAEIAFASNPNSAYLRETFSMLASGNSFLYADIPDFPDYALQAGDYLEYDLWHEESLAKIALDFTCSDGTALRNLGIQDQNGKDATPNQDLDSVALGQWYHRKFSLTNPSLIGKTITFWDLGCESDATGDKHGRIRDIQITDGFGTVRSDLWRQVQPKPLSFVNHLMAPVGGASSTTTSAVGAGATSVPLNSTASFPASGEAVSGSVVFAYTGKNPGALTGCTRTPAIANGGTVATPSVESLAVSRDYETPSFTDVTPYLLEAHPRHGRKKSTDRAEAGTCQVILDSSDRRFDPENSTSPYWPNVLGGRRARIRIRHYWELLKADGADSVWRLNEPAYSPPDTVVVIADSVGNVRGATSGVTGSAVTLGAAAVLYGDNEETTASFDGGDYIDFGDYYRLAANTPFSVTAVIRPDAASLVNDGVRRHIVGTVHMKIGSREGWQLQIFNKRIRISRFLNGVEQQVSGTSDLTAAAIYVIHATYDGTTLRIYVNGALVASAASGQALSNEAAALRMGDSAVTGEGYAGIISSVAVADTVFTATQITSHYDKVSFAFTGSLFDGYIRDWPLNWTGRLVEADIMLDDASPGLGQALISGFRAIELSGPRISWALDQANFPGDRAIDPGRSLVEESSVASGTLLDNDPALEQLLSIAESEGGIFFIDASGRAVFHDRLRRLLSASAVQGTFTNDPVNVSVGALLAVGITPSKSVEDVLNDIRLRPIAATTDGVAVDLGSQLENGFRALPRTVWLTSVSECQSQAQWLLAQFRKQKLRFDEIKIDPKRDLPGLVPQVIHREVSDRIRVSYRQPSGLGGAVDTAGPVVTKECHIESVEHDIVSRDGHWSWETRWSLSPAETQAYWILGDAANSLLGVSTVLGY